MSALRRSSLERRPSGGEPAVFNRRKLHAFTLGDPTLEREVIELFLQQVDEIAGAFATATAPDLWHRAAHTLRGSASTIGADALAALADEAVELAPRHADGWIDWLLDDDQARAVEQARIRDLVLNGIAQFRADIAAARIAEPA